MADIVLKPGERRLLYCKYDGDLSGVTVLCDVRRRYGEKIASMPVSIINAGNGEFTLDCDTLRWPIGLLKSDIRYVWSAGEVVTETFNIHIIQDETRSPRL